jgi:hypothetical protein
MAEYAYLPPLKSEACYLADGASRTLTAVSALTASAYAFSVFGLPLLAGFYADWINTIKDYDRAEHPYLSALGKKLSKISDVDQNGKITKTEVLTPQTAIGVFSLFSVATYISELYRTQALCDYSNTLIPF